MKTDRINKDAALVLIAGLRQIHPPVRLSFHIFQLPFTGDAGSNGLGNGGTRRSHL